MLRACLDAYEVIRHAATDAVRTLAAAEPNLTQYGVYSAVRQLLHHIADDATLKHACAQAATGMLPPIDF
jgi:hypothetical protein